MSKHHSLAKNFFSLSTASILTKLLNLFVIAYMARKLRAESYGQLNFAGAMAGYFTLITGLGLESHAVREVARQPETLRHRVDQIMALKVVTMVTAFIPFLALTLVLRKPVLVKELMCLCFVSGVVSMLRINWIFTGLERLHWVAVSTVVEQVANAVLVFAILRAPRDVLFVPLIASASFVAGGAGLYWLYVREFGWIRLAFDMPAWKATLRESAPMGISTLLVSLYYNFDTVMLSFMRTDQEVGWYNAAYKLIFAIVSFRFIIIGTVYPRASRLFLESREQLIVMMKQLARLLLAVCVPMAVGGTLLANKIISAMYSTGYEPAVAPLQILFWSAAMFVTNAVFPILLYAADRQADETRAVLAAVILNITLNFFLIPRYGIVGAAWATVASDVLMLTWMYERSQKVAQLHFFFAARTPLLSAAIMGAAIFWIRDRSLFVTVPLGAAIYVAAMAIFGGLTSADLQFLRRLLPVSRWP